LPSGSGDLVQYFIIAKQANCSRDKAGAEKRNVKLYRARGRYGGRKIAQRGSDRSAKDITYEVNIKRPSRFVGPVAGFAAWRLARAPV